MQIIYFKINLEAGSTSLIFEQVAVLKNSQTMTSYEAQIQHIAINVISQTVHKRFTNVNQGPSQVAPLVDNMC